MLVLRRLPYFIVAAHLTQPSFIHQAQLLEEIQTAVYRGWTDGLVFAAGTLLHAHRLGGLVPKVGAVGWSGDDPASG